MSGQKALKTVTYRTLPRPDLGDHTAFMQCPVIIAALGLLVLAGCSSAHYDFDLTCEKNAYWRTDLIGASGDDPLQYLSCLDANNNFLIACDRSTVQDINDVYYCMTKDKKSVRIRLVRAP